MGCNAAKNFPVEPLNGHADVSNGNAVRIISPSEPSAEMPPLVADDLQEEVLDVSVNNIQKAPQGVSFEIAFEENQEESIVKKHPPKRILERLEEPPTSPITLNKLQVKLDEAEIRRQQILAARISSAKNRAEMRTQSNVTDNADEDENIDFLKIPQEDFIPPVNSQSVSKN
ncbi:uncharacterized protein [Leptinotarsa decemlineata]|uniref:uncharacterized protein n=1 Tax=Leptinotarsa decemlineata TaxID=7539 RepID=UPI000C25558B|nr:uncharacterized protein LOC111502935 [Leptinotarsa decemlineata]